MVRLQKVLEQLNIIVGKKSNKPYFIKYMKMKFKWIVDLCVKYKITKLLEEKCYYIWLGKYFLNIKPIAWSQKKKKKTEQLVVIKNKTLCSLIDRINLKHLQTQRNYVPNIYLIKDFCTEYINSCLDLARKHTYNLIKLGTRFEQTL